MAEDIIEKKEEELTTATTVEEAKETLGIKAGKLNLFKPLLVNGTERNELTYDFEEIGINDFKLAGALASAIPGVGTAESIKQMENDYNYHLYMGFAAICAVNKDITMRDLERLKGLDLNQVQEKGRNFTLAYLVGRLNLSN